MAKTPETQAAGLDIEDETPTTPATGKSAGNAATGALLDEEPAAAPVTPESLGVDAVDFDDAEIYVRPGELAVCKETTEGIRHRFSVLPNPLDPTKAFLLRAYTHATDKGHAKCFSKRDDKGKLIGEPAFCCKGTVGQESEAKPRLGALVVEYTCVDPKTAKFHPNVGTEEVPFTFEIKALCLTQFGAKQLNNKAGETDDGVALKVHEVDYYYHAEKGKKGLFFEKLAKAAWLRSPTIKAQVLKAAEAFYDGKALAHRIARVLNVNQMKEHLGLSGGAAADDSNAFADL